MTAPEMEARIVRYGDLRPCKTAFIDAHTPGQRPDGELHHHRHRRSGGCDVERQMTRFTAATTAALVCCLALPAAAQTWSAHTSANGSLLFGGVTPPAPSMSFGCTAPAPEGLPLIETGSHESHRTGAFEITVGFFDPLFEWSESFQISGIIVTVNDTSYQLPPLELNELQGSAIYLPMTDPFVLSLFSAERLILDTGQGLAYEYPTDGLADALREAFGFCNARWVELGNPIPSSLAAAMGAAPAPAPGPVPVGYTPAAAPPFILEQIGEWCTGGGAIDLATGLGEADFDGDGLPDYVFNGLGVSCTQGINPFCGAAQCSIDVHLSSQDYQRVDGWIGLDFAIGQAADGRPGIHRYGDPSRPLELWNGNAFVPSQ